MSSSHQADCARLYHHGPFGSSALIYTASKEQRTAPIVSQHSCQADWAIDTELLDWSKALFDLNKSTISKVVSVRKLLPGISLQTLADKE